MDKDKQQNKKGWVIRVSRTFKSKKDGQIKTHVSYYVGIRSFYVRFGDITEANVFETKRQAERFIRKTNMTNASPVKT